MGKVTRKQLEDIAKAKEPDLTAADLDAAVLEFSVAFGEAATPHRETVTLRREDAGVWRLAGYAVRAS